MLAAAMPGRQTPPAAKDMQGDAAICPTPPNTHDPFPHPPAEEIVAHDLHVVTLGVFHAGGAHRVLRPLLPPPGQRVANALCGMPLVAAGGAQVPAGDATLGIIDAPGSAGVLSCKLAGLGSGARSVLKSGRLRRRTVSAPPPPPFLLPHLLAMAVSHASRSCSDSSSRTASTSS